MKNIFTLTAFIVTMMGHGTMAEAQQPAKIRRIGYVLASNDPNTPGPFINALRQGLRDLGYIDGKNILVEYRYIEGVSDRTPSLPPLEGEETRSRYD